MTDLEKRIELLEFQVSVLSETIVRLQDLIYDIKRHLPLLNLCTPQNYSPASDSSLSTQPPPTPHNYSLKL